MTTDEEYLDTLYFLKKNQMIKKNEMQNAILALAFLGGMWERVDESRVGLWEVNVTNRESIKQGHMCQRTLAKDVQLSVSLLMTRGMQGQRGGRWRHKRG